MLRFLPVNIDNDFSKCHAFREDSFRCSFGSLDGFASSIEGYEQKIRERMREPQWFYLHLWKDEEIVGQLEFKTFSFKPEFGYVHLVYLCEHSRGLGLAEQAQTYIEKTLLEQGCKGAILSVSRENTRALRHYEKSGWTFLKANPKHRQTDFWQKRFL